MQTEVRKFLALHHYLALPGIGNFKIQNSPAQIDFVNRNIASSPILITFNSDNTVGDKNFYDFLAQELQIDKEQAEHRFAAFSSSLLMRLNEQKTIYLNGIGQITKKTSNVLNFQPEETGNDYFPVLTAERVIRKNATHLIKVGEQEKTSTEMQTALQQNGEKVKTETQKSERWWIPATILALIGIAALIIHYAIHTG